MPKIFSELERKRVYQLAKECGSHKEIAQHMKEEFPDNWSSSYAHRTISKILKENDAVTNDKKTLDEMSRDERYSFIESRLMSSARFKMTFANFSREEKDLFMSEYLNVIKSTDTLTEVEEQAVFAAILEFILALQALNRKEREENWRDQSLNGEIPDTDPRFRRSADKKYQDEYNQHMNLYQKGMSELKMSRSQRLKEVRSQKQTLVDLAEMLSNKNAQSEVADEIERLAKLKDEELKKLLDNGHIHGAFDEFR